MAHGVRRTTVHLACLMALLAGLHAISGCAAGGGASANRIRDKKIEKAVKLIDEGKKLEAKGSPLLALERYNRAAQTYDSPAAYFQMGRLFEALGKSEQAAKAYEEALRLSPDYQEARFAMLALGYTPPGYTPTKEDIAVAQKWAATHKAPAISEDGLTTAGGLTAAQIEAERERIKAEAAERRVPTQAEVQALLFAAPAETRTPPTDGDMAYPSDQDIMLGTYPYHYRKAQYFQHRQQYDRAAEEYERAVEADPARLDARLDLGDMMMRMERYPRARIYFEKALEDFPLSPRPALKMGNYYLAINQLDKARENYRQATEKDPLYAEAYNNLAYMEMREKKYPEAKAILDELIKLDPNYSNAYLNRGIIASDVDHDRDTALKHFKKYVALGGSRAAEVQRWIEELEKPER